MNEHEIEAGARAHVPHHGAVPSYEPIVGGGAKRMRAALSREQRARSMTAICC
jgi:hypothetical protein